MRIGAVRQRKPGSFLGDLTPDGDVKPALSCFIFPGRQSSPVYFSCKTFLFAFHAVTDKYGRVMIFIPECLGIHQVEDPFLSSYCQQIVVAVCEPHWTDTGYVQLKSIDVL